MKSILFIHHSSVIGGASYCLLNLLKSLNKDSFVPSVLLAEDGPLADEIEKLGIRTYRFEKLYAVPYNKSFWKYSSIKRYYMILMAQKDFGMWLKEHPFDIVYFNNMMLYPYLKAAKLHGCSTVIHVREHWPLDEHRNQLKWARVTFEKYADLVIAINKYSASMFPLSPATIVYDAIDMSKRYKYIPMEQIFGEDCGNLKIFLYTGGGNKIKGALEIVQGFTREIRDSNARLLILGRIKPSNTNNSLKKMIKVALRSLGRNYYNDNLYEAIQADQRIKNIDNIYELEHIIQQSYCMLSFFTIPHANLAMVESILEGVPCIAAVTPESMEYSNNGEYSRLVKFGDYKGFCQALRGLESEYEEMLQKTMNGKEFVRNMFDPLRNAEVLNSSLLQLTETK